MADKYVDHKGLLATLYCAFFYVTVYSIFQQAM